MRKRVFLNMKEAAERLGHRPNWFSYHPEMVAKAGGFVLEGDFDSRTMFIASKVDELAKVLPKRYSLRLAEGLKVVRRARLPIRRGK